MLKVISGITVNQGNPGEAFGGGIYGFSCNFGGTGEPTKAQMSIVSEDGNYLIDDTFLNVTSTGGYDIMIGTKTFYNMHIYKYDYNQTAGQQTCTVHFVDRSLALDKIYVGLAARHFPAVPGGQQAYNFTVQCIECNNLQPNLIQSQGSVSKDISTSAIPGLVGDPINGGYLLVGKEGWIDGNCEIPKVKYTFGELITKMAAAGFTHNLGTFNRSAEYEQSYHGTLREVLNSWAADFSFSFFFDPMVAGYNIVGIDGTNPSTNITAIKQAVHSGFTGQGMIRDISESRGLEGSYKQSLIVKSMKAARPFDRKQTSFEEVTLKPITIQDAISYEGHGGRTNNELYTSIGLGKYSTEARIIWLSAQIAAGGHKDAGWPSLGFIPDPDVGHVTDPKQKAELSRIMLQSSYGNNQTFQHPIWNNPNNYDVFVGVYNKAEQAAWEAFDQELADFIGKYGVFSKGGMMVNPPADFRNCPDTTVGGIGSHKFYDLSSDVSTLPSGKLHKGGDYPFQKILRANNGVFHYGGGINADGDYIVDIPDNAWGTDASWISNLLANAWVEDPNQGGVQWITSPDDPTGNSGSSPATDPNNPRLAGVPQSDLAHYVPIFARFPRQRLINSALKNIFPNFDIDYVAQSDRMQGYFPGVAMIPKMPITLTDPTNGQSVEILTVSGLGTGYNARVFDNRRRRVLEQQGDSKKDCTLFCEESIVQEVCECPDINDPIHHHNSYQAKSITVGHLSKSPVDIVYPVENDYIGYWKADMVFRGTYPKQMDILGTPPAPAVGLFGNAMETRIIDEDVTQDIDPVIGGGQQGFVQSFLVNGHATPLSLGAFYQLLASVNQEVTSATMGGAAPTQQLNVKIDSTDFDALAGFISPLMGLVSMSMTLDGEGVSTNLTFANRHPKPPKRDVLLQKIGPRALDGQFGRPGINFTGHSGLNMPFIP